MARLIKSSKSSSRKEALAWFACLEADEVSEATKAKFDAWYAADKKHAEEFEQISALWLSPEFNIASQRVNEKIELSQRSTTKSWLANFTFSHYGAIASLVCVLVLVSQLLQPWYIRNQVDYSTITGEQNSIILEDGTELTLNTNTLVNLHFDNSSRNLELISGEIFLHVKKEQNNRPFIVHTETARVEVVGTEFSVEYASNSTVVNGLSGVVSVSDNNNHVACVLKGDRVISTSTSFLQESMNPDQTFAWLNGRLSFTDISLEEVINEFDRYYPGSILISGEELSQTRVSGSYQLSSPVLAVESLLEAIDANSLQLSPWVLVIYK